ncbi:uncharacterized protein LOC122391498 [Amphibalanus amphitrite]|uniref:uncharacterized protein LOC122391498 n=1 Tax=Amphibalanus amphitrite TaxID=1232801 RepID=UPI001C91F0A8|nr:uncharacterized protein LOC122391498 [Amphibalanus amphitrite]
MGCCASKNHPLSGHLAKSDYRLPALSDLYKLKRTPQPLEPDGETDGFISARLFHNLYYSGFYAPYICNPEYLLLLDCRYGWTAAGLQVRPDCCWTAGTAGLLLDCRYGRTAAGLLLDCRYGRTAAGLLLDCRYGRTAAGLQVRLDCRYGWTAAGLQVRMDCCWTAGTAGLLLDCRYCRTAAGLQVRLDCC